MIKILTNLDKFGIGINLTLNKKTTSNSLIRRLLTIILNIFLIVMFYISANDVINHSHKITTIIQDKWHTLPKSN